MKREKGNKTGRLSFRLVSMRVRDAELPAHLLLGEQQHKVQALQMGAAGLGLLQVTLIRVNVIMISFSAPAVMQMFRYVCKTPWARIMYRSPWWWCAERLL